VQYSAEVLDRVQALTRVGVLPAAAPDVGTGEAGTLDAGTVTRIQVREQPYDIPFYYHPREIEDIVVRDHDADTLLTARNRTVEQVFVSVDPDAGAKVAAIAGVEIARLTGSKYGLLNLPTTGALTRPDNTTADYPILTCKDATPATVISKAPTISVRLRPYRSAVVVSQSEIPASPTSVRVKRRLICRSVRPISAK